MPGETITAARGRRIGLLGGSFNPAHEGHLHISREALKRLRLDEVWWLVSPQNPLKPRAGMAELAERVAAAQQVAHGRRIKVTDIESKLGTRYTIDTLRALQRRFPGVRFVWLMGADNLAQIARWRGWRQIFGLLPIAVFDRPAYSLRALSSQAARRFASQRIKPEQAFELAARAAPAWVFIRSRLHPASATAIRAGKRIKKG
ncbi:MAG: nicotinate-nucleotide adenylyltransferase [Rhodospirillales bacterium]